MGITDLFDSLSAIIDITDYKLSTWWEYFHVTNIYQIVFLVLLDISNKFRVDIFVKSVLESTFHKFRDNVEIAVDIESI